MQADVFPPLFFNIWLQKAFPLRSLFLDFQWDSEDEGILGQGSFGAVTVGEWGWWIHSERSSQPFSSASWCAASFPHHARYWGAPLGFSGYLEGLWNKKVLQWIFFFPGCELWVRLSQISGVFFLVFAYINWMISGSRLGLRHPVMILNWRMISGGKTLLFLLHIILTECIFLI